MSDEVSVLPRVKQPHGGELRVIDSATAKQMQAASVQARRNNAAKAARSRLTRELAAIDPTITSAADAAGAMVAAVGVAVVQAAADGKPRGDDMMRVLQATGYAAMPHEREPEREVGQAAELVTALTGLLQAFDAARQAQGRG